MHLNAGAIRSVSSGNDAILEHGGLDHDPAHKVNWRLSPTRSTPVVSQAIVDAAVLTLTVDVDLSPSSRKPTPNEFVVKADGEVISLADADAVAANADTITLNLASPVNPGQSVTVSYVPVASPIAALFADQPAVNLTSAPVVTGLEVVSDPGDGDTYLLDDVIRIRVTFSEAVSVLGTPRLRPRMDPSYGEKLAVYETGSGANILTFIHTVVRPNFSSQGVALLADSLELNGSAIRSAATLVGADLSHAGLRHDPRHKVDWRDQRRR